MRSIMDRYLLRYFLAIVETASQALKRRRHAREARHVCGVCHTTHSS